MAGPIAMAVALGRLVTIRCPYCRHAKQVERRPAQFRVCPRCHRHYPDPIGRRR